MVASGTQVDDEVLHRMLAQLEAHATATAAEADRLLRLAAIQAEAQAAAWRSALVEAAASHAVKLQARSAAHFTPLLPPLVKSRERRALLSFSAISQAS
eukprot:scaffold307922_cov27-Tisochrysis_lutea.AAC.1